MRTLSLLILVIVAGCSCLILAQSPIDSVSTQPTVRLCIPVMENSSTNSINRFLARDRLINEFKPTKKRKDKTVDAQPVTPVALDAENARDARREAGEKKCDYILFTKVVELRGRGERRPVGKPTEGVTIGRDPMGAYGLPKPGDSEEVYRAVVEYRLERYGQLGVLLDTSVSTIENTSADSTVQRVLNIIANRTRQALGER